MPDAGFPTVPLARLCDQQRPICYGIVQPGKSTIHGVPIVRVNNFGGGTLDLSDALMVAPEVEAKFKRSRPRAHDVLITLVGSIGQIALAPEEIEGWNVARAVGVVPTTDLHHAHWIYFALLAPPAQRFMQERANTTVQATFNLRDLAELPIPYPSAPIRERILGRLLPLKQKIELNRRTNETLEGLAQAIFRDWFVGFGPVRRKLAGERDPVAVVGGLTPDPTRAAELAALFPDALDEMGLPKGWSVQPFGSLLESSVSGDWGKDIPDDVHTERAATIRGTDMPAILAGLRDRVPERCLAPSKLSKKQLADLDVVIEVSGGSQTQPTGRSIMVTQSILDRFDCPVVCASFCRRFRFKSPRLAFLGSQHLSVLYSDGGTWEWQNQSTGIANFQTTRFLEAHEVIVADDPVLEAFAGLIEAPVRRSSCNESLWLADTRDYLLPRLLSGMTGATDPKAECVA